MLPISFSESKFRWKRLAIHLTASIADWVTSDRISPFSTLRAPTARSYWCDGILALLKLPGKPTDVIHSCTGTSESHCDCDHTWLQSGPSYNHQQRFRRPHPDPILVICWILPFKMRNTTNHSIIGTQFTKQFGTFSAWQCFLLCHGRLHSF